MSPDIFGRLKRRRTGRQGDSYGSIFSRWVDHPKVVSTRTSMQTRLHVLVVPSQSGLDASQLEDPREESLAARRMMQIVTRSGKCSDQQSPSLAVTVLDGCDAPVRVVASCLSALHVIILQEVASEDILSLDFKRQVIQKIRSEFDVVFACSKYSIQAEVGLNGSSAAMIAEVRRQALAYKHSTLLHILSKLVRGAGIQHNRIRQVDDFVPGNIVEGHEIRLNV